MHEPISSSLSTHEGLIVNHSRVCRVHIREVHIRPVTYDWLADLSQAQVSTTSHLIKGRYWSCLVVVRTLLTLLYECVSPCWAQTWVVRPGLNSYFFFKYRWNSFNSFYLSLLWKATNCTDLIIHSLFCY